MIPVLLYLFRRIEQRLDGSPTLILLDEAWSYLQHELFRDRLKDWLKTMRRKNAVVVMATQQISDIANSEIADVVLENCPTKILLPNAEAKNPGSREFYDRVGLNERELEILQVSIPKQHYYVVSKLGRRLVDLGSRQSGAVLGRRQRSGRTPDCRKRDGAVSGHLADRVAAAQGSAAMGGVFRGARRGIDADEEEEVSMRKSLIVIRPVRGSRSKTRRQSRRELSQPRSRNCSTMRSSSCSTSARASNSRTRSTCTRTWCENVKHAVRPELRRRS